MRFPEFKEGWEVKKLGEISTNKSKKYNPNNETNFIKCIELEHLSSETGQLLGFVDGSQSGSIKNVFQKGDVLFGKLRPYLKKYYQPNFDGVCSSEIWVLNGKEILNDFLYYLIQTNSFVDLANQSSGSKMPRADWSILENGLFSFPNSEEQQKIASFLSLIDERIQTQNKIIEGLKKLKVATAKKIFSQEFRFKDNNGNDFSKWEEMKLKNIVIIQMGQSPDSSSYNFENIGIPLIQGNADILNRKSNPRQYTSKPTKFCDVGDLLLTVRAPVGYVGKSKHYACIGRGICSVKNNDKSILEFIYQFLLYFEDKWKSIEQGSTFTAVNSSDINSINILLPSIPEQTKIANFLSAIDSKIDMENQLLQKLEEQKKFLLQNMFV